MNSFTYNKRLQPINMSAVSPTATVFSLNYDFHVGAGDNGNVWGITNNKDTSRNQAFTYDALNRLTSAQNAGTDCSKTTVNGKTEYWGNNYGYDAWGNLLEKTVTKCSAENLSVTALANNQLSGYSYDSAGNMTHDATSGLNYSYDQENRITGAAGYAYTYDGDGNRVKKSNGSTGTLYWYMSPGIVAESDLSGNLTSEYVFFDGERVARKDFPSNTVSYYFSDHLKTTDIVTDAQGNIKNESDLYPWGGELQFSNNDSNHYKFTGKERDSETGLDYFGARYYSNGLGRFITPDWAAKATAVPYAAFGDPQSLNLYSYVRNSPIVRVDADGHADGMLQRPRGGVDDGSGGLGGSADDRYDVTTTTSITTYREGGGSTHTVTNQIQTIQQVGSSQTLYKGPAWVPQNLNPSAAASRFRSRKAAGIAAEKRALVPSGKSGWEYGGWILKGQGGYTYTTPVTFQSSAGFFPDNVIVPKGFQKVAAYHTHPSPGSWGEGFSVPDINWADSHHMVIYVGMTFSGNIRVYVPGVTQYHGLNGVTGDLVYPSQR
jgi:RHS repeat-associated protein